jgi:hypothetical protein
MATKMNKYVLPGVVLAGLGLYFAFGSKDANAAPAPGTPTPGGGVTPPGAKTPPPPVPVVKEPITPPATFSPAPPSTYTSKANPQLAWRITNPTQGFWFAEPLFKSDGTFFDYWRKFEANDPQTLPAIIETWIAYVASSLSNDAAALDAAKSAAAGLPISSEGSRGPTGGSTTAPTGPYVDPRSPSGSGSTSGGSTGR